MLHGETMRKVVIWVTSAAKSWKLVFRQVATVQLGAPTPYCFSSAQHSFWQLQTACRIPQNWCEDSYYFHCRRINMKYLLPTCQGQECSSVAFSAKMEYVSSWVYCTVVWLSLKYQRAGSISILQHVSSTMRKCIYLLLLLLLCFREL